MTDKQNKPVMLDADKIKEKVRYYYGADTRQGQAAGYKRIIDDILNGDYSTPVEETIMDKLAWVDTMKERDKISDYLKTDSVEGIKEYLHVLCNQLLSGIDRARQAVSKPTPVAAPMGIDVEDWKTKIGDATQSTSSPVTGKPAEFIPEDVIHDLLTAIEKAQSRRHVVVENRSTGSWDVVDMHERIAVFYTSMQCKNGELEAQAHADKLDGVGQEEKWEKSGRRSSNLYGLFSPDGEEIAEIHEEYIDAVLNALNRGEE